MTAFLHLDEGTFELPSDVVRKHAPALIEAINRKRSMLAPYLEGFATAKEGKVKSVSGKWALMIGSPVIYVDSLGVERPALITNMFGPVEANPSINVVVVNKDEDQTDTYGRKIERFTSVVHEVNQYAHGNYWKPISE